MYKNIAKRIQLLAVIMAIVLLVTAGVLLFLAYLLAKREGLI